MSNFISTIKVNCGTYSETLQKHLFAIVVLYFYLIQWNSYPNAFAGSVWFIERISLYTAGLSRSTIWIENDYHSGHVMQIRLMQNRPGSGVVNLKRLMHANKHLGSSILYVYTYNAQKYAHVLVYVTPMTL